MGRATVAMAVTLWAMPISILVNQIVPNPYMDEIFHVPQAQQYCRGNWSSWDPMITTPPGLYFLSLAWIAPLFPAVWSAKVVETFSDLCSTSFLRTTNGLMAVICAVILYDLIIKLRPGVSEKNATIFAIILATYPLHWFFTFLYYTDVVSLAVVLAMYLASLEKKYFISAMLGALATLFRQTNIIWMIFVAANGVFSYIENHHKKDPIVQMMTHNNLLRGSRDIPSSTGLRQRILDSKSIDKVNSIHEESPCHSSGILNETCDFASKLWCLKWKIAITFAPFFFVLLAFVTFVIWNGSIVLGAKEAHSVSPHFAQIFYFGLASAAAIFPVHFTFAQVATICQALGKNKIGGFCLVVVALVAGFVAIHFFSIAHPYLLADNRHYTFYIWRKIIQAHWMMKYLLVPLYVYSWLSVVIHLRKSQTSIWVLSYTVATALVLVPAPLVEFRYYTIPFYFLALHSQINKASSWLVIGSVYIVVNVFTLTMFLYYPFHWNHETGIQRFIW